MALRDFKSLAGMHIMFLGFPSAFLLHFLVAFLTLCLCDTDRDARHAKRNYISKVKSEMRIDIEL